MGIKIIGGRFKGFLINIPKSARPTLSRYRQTLFDTLEALFIKRKESFYGKIVLDCFAGSGALGLEAISRGASRAYFFDSSKEAISVLRNNIKKLQVGDISAVFKCDLEHFSLRNLSNPCDLIFIDPPYGKITISLILEKLSLANWVSENTLIAIEYSSTNPIDISDKYQTISSKKYKTSSLLISTLKVLSE
ncbi:MAG: 16S rRNA (guanine(966)-N(2))-methyltransferase RsmD [Holosporaceae bacterium]|nr:16S rRNA (guanine(966)-N(2))-methyltransferase RsmD [Holosporaceae bacterium]